MKPSSHELKSFEGAYDIELHGAIEIAGEVAADIIAELAQREAGRVLSPTAEERAKIIAHLKAESGGQ